MRNESTDSVPLRAYIEAVIQNEHDLNEARFHSSQEAVTQFRTTTESRFASVNEFRGTLTDQAMTFATREALAAVDKEMSEISRRLATLEARLLASGGFMVFILGLASVIVIWLHK
jgi:hypothetical protein